MHPPNSFLLANFPIAEARDLGQLAAKRGTERVWLAETFGPEFSVVASLLASTTELELGTAIIPIYTRTPTIVGLLTSSITEVSGRPFHLGIGTGGQATIERWNGIPYKRNLARMRDYVAIVRQVISGEKTKYEGEVLSAEGYRLPWPPRADVLIYIGAMGEKMVDLATEVADGIILSWVTPRILESYIPQLREKAAAAGRDPEKFRIVARMYCSASDDRQAVREKVRDELVGYAASPAQADYFADWGFDAEIAAFRAAFAAGDREGSRNALSDAMIDELIPTGSEDQLRAAAEARWACGIDDLMVQMVPSALNGEPRRTLEALT